MATRKKPNSLEYKNSRYIQGGLTQPKPGRLGWWERDIIPTAEDDITFVVTVDFAQRPDMIAYAAYDNPTLAWLVLQYNTIQDVETELVVGKTIKLPSRNRVLTSILSRPIGKTLIE